jgi:PST family polysaccharide transporter
MISALSITIYMRLDQVMIRFILGESSAGIYSAAVTLCELWYFIPMAIVQAFFPRIIALKHLKEQYFALIERIGRHLVLLAYSFAMLVTISSSSLIELIYGPAYAMAAPALTIGVWAGVFVALGLAQGPWSVSENLQKLALYRTLCGAASNIFLNLIFIPLWGMTGAAAATCLSYAISAFITNYFASRTRPFFYLQLRMLLPYAR